MHGECLTTGSCEPDYLLMKRILLFAVVLVSLPLSAGPSRGVISAFKGQIVISHSELPEGRNDKDTIAKIKAARLKELSGSANADNIKTWNFHCTSFLRRPGSSSLRLVFSVGGRPVASKEFTGRDPKSSVLFDEITIDEDEGIEQGKLHTIQLVADKTVVAETKLVMK